MAQHTVSATVLVVEDDTDLAEVYSKHLEGHYRVRIAHSGEEALATLDSEPDVVLLDRKLPDMSGEELVEVCRQRASECRIAMVTGVSPDFDIVEMAIDDYLVKPVDADDLIETVEKLLDTDALDEKKLELSSKQVKRNVLRVEKREAELAKSDEFKRLEDRINRLKSQIASIESNQSEQGNSA